MADICDYEQGEELDGIITKDMLFHLSDDNLIHVLQKFLRWLRKDGSLCIIMDVPKEAGEQIFVEELDNNYQIYYNYLTIDKLKCMLEMVGFKVEKVELIQDNSNASSYANGLMIFYATK